MASVKKRPDVTAPAVTHCQDNDCKSRDPVEATRSDAKFCSNACRQRAYRRRRRILTRFGSWEAALEEIVTPTVTAGRFVIRNAERG